MSCPLQCVLYSKYLYNINAVYLSKVCLYRRVWVFVCAMPMVNNLILKPFNTLTIYIYMHSHHSDLIYRHYVRFAVSSWVHWRYLHLCCILGKQNQRVLWKSILFVLWLTIVLLITFISAHFLNYHFQEEIKSDGPSSSLEEKDAALSKPDEAPSTETDKPVADKDYGQSNPADKDMYTTRSWD